MAIVFHDENIVSYLNNRKPSKPRFFLYKHVLIFQLKVPNEARFRSVTDLY